MQRYHFHFKWRDDAVFDEQGIELKNFPAAYLHACELVQSTRSGEITVPSGLYLRDILISYERSFDLLCGQHPAATILSRGENAHLHELRGPVWQPFAKRKRKCHRVNGSFSCSPRAHMHL